MDKILEGLVSSSHPLPVKRVIVRRVVESAETPLSQAQCRAMFALSTRLILQGPDSFQRQVGRQVLEAYARFHRDEFEAFFNRGLVLGLLQRGYGGLGSRDPAILDYVQAGLRLIISCPSVLELFALLQVEALRMVCERPAPPLCARLCQLLGDFPQCLPRGRKLSLAFCQQLVRSIAHFQSQGSRESELRLYVSQVTQVSGLLRSIWKAEPDTLLPSLQELFAVISSTDTSFEPSVALASLVQHIPLQMITVLIRSLTTDPNVKDASMTQALCRMIDWLSWPLAQHVETWVIALLKGLAAVQKFTILIDVTLLKIELVFNRLWFPLVRPGALAVLSHMLLSFQHSPEAFHLELPKPSEEKIKLILNQSAWTSQSSSLPSCLSRFSGKSETGKTGLVNLGNTCYMNSVIQALFMATDFRRHVLSLNLNGCNSLMRKLQHLFAFLAHTQREAYAPRIFFEASRPPWFTPRSQQDCSEYLRFLLDRLHEEERTLKALSSAKPSENMMSSESLAQETANKAQVFTEAPCTGGEERTLIEKMFGGKLQTSICCLNCKSTSQKEEAFTDLSLAFCPLTSLDNVDMRSITHSSEVKDDCMVQTGIVASSPVEESALDISLAVSDRCETVMNEGILKDHLPAELNSANVTDSDLYRVQDTKNVSQKPVSENTPSVTDLLNYFLAPEILNGDNKYYCEKCTSLQNAEKIMQIMEEPEYLILTLLRFSYDPKCHIRRKILDNVSLPLILELPVKRTASSLGVVSKGWSVDIEFSDTGENLAKKLKPSGAEEACCPELVPYVLSSVVVHSGISSESGHYYSYARNITGSGPSLGLCHQSKNMALASHGSLLAGEVSHAVIENDLDANEMSKEWFLFNDSRVTFTSFQSVQKITSRFPKDTAYVLLYKKQNCSNGFNANSANGLWVNGDPPLQKELMDAITKDNKLYLQEQELSARTQALQAASTSCSFRPNGFDDNDPPGSCGPTGGGGGGGFSTIGRLVF
ncbi:ubiquitin carboxyl-terminal hydrolase 38 isoform X2 [Chelonoidis abingdonii]|uniref:ubiquitin carboxyl-terminal hydrolase 38 isoform X2 n=1 Tax=Chelonoidis abingdonii TaxID=106734 RepID=UPI0013F1C108|nr:ubiquitin carboxyl-terminal hydrolase 38 isoform X2 [Chelonoidis abingdonii]